MHARIYIKKIKLLSTLQFYWPLSSMQTRGVLVQQICKVSQVASKALFICCDVGTAIKHLKITVSILTLPHNQIHISDDQG